MTGVSSLTNSDYDNCFLIHSYSYLVHILYPPITEFVLIISFPPSDPFSISVHPTVDWWMLWTLSHSNKASYSVQFSCQHFTITLRLLLLFSWHDIRCHTHISWYQRTQMNHHCPHVSNIIRSLTDMTKVYGNFLCTGKNTLLRAIIIRTITCVKMCNAWHLQFAIDPS